MRVEIDSLEQFRRQARDGGLARTVVQGLDLHSEAEAVRAASCEGAVFLGCQLDERTTRHVEATGGLIFPRLPDLPYKTYRPSLYSVDELLEGYRRGEPATYGQSLDRKSTPTSTATGSRKAPYRARGPGPATARPRDRRRPGRPAARRRFARERSAPQGRRDHGRSFHEAHGAGVPAGGPHRPAAQPARRAHPDDQRRRTGGDGSQSPGLLAGPRGRHRNRAGPRDPRPRAGLRRRGLARHRPRGPGGATEHRRRPGHSHLVLRPRATKPVRHPHRQVLLQQPTRRRPAGDRPSTG